MSPQECQDLTNLDAVAHHWNSSTQELEVHRRAAESEVIWASKSDCHASIYTKEESQETYLTASIACHLCDNRALLPIGPALRL